MKAKIAYLFLLIALGGCLQTGQKGGVAKIDQDVLSEEEEILYLTNGKCSESNYAIRTTVRSGMFKQGESYSLLARRVCRPKYFMLPRNGVAETYTTISRAFVSLPKDEINSENVLNFLADMPCGYKTRAAVMLIESQKLDSETHKVVMEYYVDELDSPTPCRS